MADAKPTEPPSGRGEKSAPRDDPPGTGPVQVVIVNPPSSGSANDDPNSDSSKPVSLLTGTVSQILLILLVLFSGGQLLTSRSKPKAEPPSPISFTPLQVQLSDPDKLFSQLPLLISKVDQLAVSVSKSSQPPSAPVKIEVIYPPTPGQAQAAQSPSQPMSFCPDKCVAPSSGVSGSATLPLRPSLSISCCGAKKPESGSGNPFAVTYTNEEPQKTIQVFGLHARLVPEAALDERSAGECSGLNAFPGAEVLSTKETKQLHLDETEIKAVTGKPHYLDLCVTFGFWGESTIFIERGTVFQKDLGDSVEVNAGGADVHTYVVR